MRRESRGERVAQMKPKDFGKNLGVRQEKESQACGLTGFINEDGTAVSGEIIWRSICNMRERGNGLGGGFAGYGIYPDYRECYAFHLMYDGERCREQAEEMLSQRFEIEKDEPIPVDRIPELVEHTTEPILRRYFLRPREIPLDGSEDEESARDAEAEYVIKAVMDINLHVDGAYVFSSGKNMGAFKAVGHAEYVGLYYKIYEYKGYMWIAHDRFPTNTQAWWGGAHPFTLLDWAVVHNGEISSYGINKRYLEEHGYYCTLFTDTEVMAYLMDLLVRRHKLPVEVACDVIAPPFWRRIDRMPAERRELYRAIRAIYGSAEVNGPFAVIIGSTGRLIGFNDRIKLRPMVCARKGDTLYVASEEAAIREICDAPDIVWTQPAGSPAIGQLKNGAAKVAGEPEWAERPAEQPAPAGGSAGG